MLSTTALPTIARGDLYKQMEWVVLDAHSLLLDIMLARADDPQHVVKRCQGLSAFIRCATIGENPQLAALQLKVSQLSDKCWLELMLTCRTVGGLLWDHRLAYLSWSISACYSLELS